MTRWILFLSVVMVFALPVSLGGANDADEGNCGQRNIVLNYLSSKYSEKPIAMGVAANGGLIEVLSSHEGTTFTIIVTMPEGQTCMVAAGEGWERLPLAAITPQI
ncbi:MAG: hypothetical protein MJE12_06930 [Alphaproteobacteria bacterium]|nr:hypothetical protein [Alphaproteobacteria bacterium]